MAEAQKAGYGSGEKNTRPTNVGGKSVPPPTHSLRAAEGYADSKGYVPNVYIRTVSGEYGESLKLNVPKGQTVTLSEGTYYINRRKPVD